MDISALSNVTSEYLKDTVRASDSLKMQGEEEFEGVLRSAMDMVGEANDLQNKAEESEMQFMLGYANNTHDLMAIQEKADIALNYTIAVRDRMVEAYKEIMQIQI